MKNFFFKLLFLVVLPINVFSQFSVDKKQNAKIDSLNLLFDQLQIENTILKSKLDSFQNKINSIKESLVSVKDFGLILVKVDSLNESYLLSLNNFKESVNKKADLNKVIEIVETLNLNLSKNIEKQNKMISKNSDNLNAFNSEFSSIQDSIISQKYSIMSNTSGLEKNNQYAMTSLTLGLLLLIICLIIYFLVSRNKSEISETQNEVKQVYNLDTEIKNLIEKQTGLLKSFNKGDSNDNSTDQVKMVADEIVTMENNIYHMDPKTRGLKKIKRAIKNLRNNFLVIGYDIPILLGNELSEGDKIEIIAELPDENIEKGKRIITRIVKPRIDFNGKMIQRAKVEIKYNI